MNDRRSILGYSKGSPYAKDPYIDIFSPDGLIDMSNTPEDLLGIDEFGNQAIMRAGRKEQYKFQGKTIREIPLDQMAMGGLTSSKAKEMLRDGTANGKKLTKKQKRYFGWVAGGKMQEGGNPFEQEAIDFLFGEDEVVAPVEQQPDNDEIDVRELELAKREQQLRDDEEYNQALMIAMQAGENPFQLENSGGSGYRMSKFVEEKIDNKAAYSYNFLLNKGYSPEVASGIVANIKHESNFNTGAVGDAGKARGIAQWHPDRYSRLKKSFDLNSLEGSLEAMHHELQTSERGAWDKIKRARTPEEAAILVDRYYERSKGLSTGQRINTSKNIYNSLNR